MAAAPCAEVFCSLDLKLGEMFWVVSLFGSWPGFCLHDTIGVLMPFSVQIVDWMSVRKRFDPGDTKKFWIYNSFGIIPSLGMLVLCTPSHRLHMSLSFEQFNPSILLCDPLCCPCWKTLKDCLSVCSCPSCQFNILKCCWNNNYLKPRCWKNPLFVNNEVGWTEQKNGHDGR